MLAVVAAITGGLIATTARAHDDGPPVSADVAGGFFIETIDGPWVDPTGVTFTADGRMVVWARDGRVWMTSTDGTPADGPVIDIREEVGGWRDHGLLGVAPDPNFARNGRLYLLYVVDDHHLQFAGTPEYSPTSNSYFHASIGRITRFALDPATSFTTIVPESRTVLLGETIDAGIPILHESHGVGSLVFGTDGTLLASCGDSASYLRADNGGSSADGWSTQGVELGIIPAANDVGAFRSQMIESLCGKILRLDPETGDGVPGNPHFDPDAPRAAASRVYALGLRNPFRFCVRPETGSHVVADGSPGTLYIGDVGWGGWEELNIARAAGTNFGWPLYEGADPLEDYTALDTEHPHYPNALGCTTNFLFRDLLQPATSSPATSFEHPCDASQVIPSTVPVFHHRRPTVEWSHDGVSRTAAFDASGAPIMPLIGDDGSDVDGPQFGGSASIGGVWYTGMDFPETYRDTYFHADWSGRWIRVLRFNENDEPVEVVGFAFAPGTAVTSLTTHPVAGGIVFVRSAHSVRRLRYGGNIPPIARITTDVLYGVSPLTVQFSGLESSDDDGDALSYAWDFGDGSPPTSNPEPIHTFTASGTAPESSTVTLTVTDPSGGTSTTTSVVSLNNTPPDVRITSPPDGVQYPLTSSTMYELTAEVSDPEHDDESLSCAWQTILHHNDHTHDEPLDQACATTTLISPVGCDGNEYHYRIRLTVTDAHGLSSSDEVILTPACDDPAVCIADCSPAHGDGTFGNGVVNIDDLFAMIVAFGTAGGRCDIAPDHGDGTFGNDLINIDDIIMVINAFGPCG